MRTEPPVVFTEKLETSGSRLPKIVYHSPGFPMEEWGDLVRESGFSLRCIHSLSEILPGSEALSVILLDEDLADEKELRKLDEACRNGVPVSFVSVVSPGGETGLQGEPSKLTAGILQTPITGAALDVSLRAAFRQAGNRLTARQNEILREVTSRNLENLTQIGIALSAERNTHRLLDLILTISRELTIADAGSIYLIEEFAEGEKNLRFKHTQNDSKEIPFKEFVMPVSKASISGYAAVTGETLNIPDVYQIPEGEEYGFNQSFDQSVGYRSKSMLVVPMTDHNNEITGVLQLINAKRSPDTRLPDPETAEKEVIDFDPAFQGLIQSLASQAAVALENSMLLESIQNTFEGLVKASVHAIEQRDPITSGHSERVTKLTCSLAKAVSDTKEGPYADVTYTEVQIKELRYAGLLHDFGKIGVKEDVLLKENKLYPLELEVVKNRFTVIKYSILNEYQGRMIDGALGGAKDGVEKLRKEVDRRLAEIQEHLDLIIRANRPAAMPDEEFDKLLKIGSLSYRDFDGQEKPYLTPHEIRALSVKRGNLTSDERKEIESHASYSYNFLVQIPWTKELRGIPEIAHGHHEKLNGDGYPQGLTDHEIILQAKIMCVCDIFDALTASDRPYKKAATLEESIQILRMEVADGHLSPELVDIFVKQKIYRAVEAFEDADYIELDS